MFYYYYSSSALDGYAVTPRFIVLDDIIHLLPGVKAAKRSSVDAKSEPHTEPSTKLTKPSSKYFVTWS